MRYESGISGETRKGCLVQGNVRPGKVDSEEVDLSGFVVMMGPYEGKVYLAGVNQA